jgi:hypothetical protein
MLEQLREGLSEKTETARTARDVIAAGLRVKKDRILKEWYDRNLKDCPSYQTEDVIRRAIDLKEISQSQAEDLLLLRSFVSSETEKNPEKVEKVRAGLKVSDP